MIKTASKQQTPVKTTSQEQVNISTQSNQGSNLLLLTLLGAGVTALISSLTTSVDTPTLQPTEDWHMSFAENVKKYYTNMDKCLVLYTKDNVYTLRTLDDKNYTIWINKKQYVTPDEWNIGSCHVTRTRDFTKDSYPEDLPTEVWQEMLKWIEERIKNKNAKDPDAPLHQYLRILV